MNYNENERWKPRSPKEELFLKKMYSIDPYLYGLHPKRKLSHISYAIHLRIKKDEEKIAIRKRHEYFLYKHVYRNYDEINKFIVTETLWKAKQF